ncbi:hypothetical protein FRC01_014809 [Tulasnella sp. 417]|nr:hypothetical protein FRC01_014809 [Tulasnella sp. 417]
MADLEFDLLEDRDRCLNRLGYDPSNPKYTPADVRRIPDIVNNPQFTVNGATASDICQGALGNCWFLSALTVIATACLIDKICRDEEMGIYGFIFWRDSGWVGVIVDDLVFTKVRPWDALSAGERDVYRNDRRTYNNTARRGLFTNLYFAKSRTDNETWVPLIEKAYAKLHGDYESLEDGFTSEGVEDLTGGVSTLIYRGDIPDIHDFWNEELSKVGEDRLFACFTPGSTPGGADRDLQPLGALEIEGLLTNHAYSITKAVEFTGKDRKYRGRFLRNPWGRKEWSGRWSDGSEEWNEKWTEELRKALGDYRFGDDGEFVQEYSDFLDCWGIIERSRLFGDGWIMSSQWLQMPPDTHLRPWSLGEVSFTVEITGSQDAKGPSETIIVLAQRDTRYFKELSGPYLWSMDFLLYPRGADLPIARSVHSSLWDRSVKLEILLKPGEYVVHARLDCKRKIAGPSTTPVDWRKNHRKQMEQTSSAMVAANCNHGLLPFQNLSVPPAAFAGRDLSEIELQLNYEALHARFEPQAPAILFGSPMQDPRGLDTTPITLEVPDPDSREPTPTDLLSSRQTSMSGALSPVENGGISGASSVRAHRSTYGTIPPLHPESIEGPPSLSQTHHTSPNQAPGHRTGSGPRGVPGRWPTVSSRGPTADGAVPDKAASIPGDPLSSEDIASKKLGYARNDDQKYKHEDFVCKDCQKVIVGPMILCLETMCHGCHLCLDCMEKEQVHRSHRFIVSTCAEDDRTLVSAHQPTQKCPRTQAMGPSTGANDADPPSELVLGLRVYTRSTAKATVKGQLSLVFTKVRPWDALSAGERDVYRNDRRTYNNTARRGLFTNLYFAKSRTDNETWVPLIEKAYAKLHGDYESLEGGFTSEGVEDLTGGVSTLIYRGDIPNVDDFWNEELSKVGEDRLFACFTPGSTPGGADRDLQSLGAFEIEGLLMNHAYSITKAVEFTSQDRKYTGRFLRNPWGRKEWSGRWSDGSEEWNEKWTEELRKALGNYQFGDDGEFVQEYSDFLDCWGIIERSRLFGDEWIMSSQWIQMPSDTHLRPWSFGEVSFTVDITGSPGAEGPSETIIVLAQHDTRYFKELSGSYLWSMDFLLYPRGEELPIARSVHSTLWDRSVKLEIFLEPGEYVVHARLDCKRKRVGQSTAPIDWRKHNRKQMEQTSSAMVATNCNHCLLPFQYLSVPPAAFAGRDLSAIEHQLNYEALQARFESQIPMPVSESPVQSSTGLDTTLRRVLDLEPEAPSPIALRTGRRTSFSGLLAPVEKGCVVCPVSVRPHRRARRAATLCAWVPPPHPESIEGQLKGESLSQTRHGSPHQPPGDRESSSLTKMPGRWPTVSSPGPTGDKAFLDNAAPVPDHSLSRENVATKQLEYARKDNQKFKHQGFICKDCQEEIVGPMALCLETMCLGCHLCLDCMEKEPVHKNHKFIVSTCAEDDKALVSAHQSTSPSAQVMDLSTAASDADPPSDLVLGLRVYTRSNAKATVKSQLRTGSILRKHFFTPKPTES